MLPASAAAVRPPQRAYVGRGRPRRPRTCLLAGRRASAVVGPGMRARRQWSAQACACIGSGRPGLRARRQWSAKERARRSAGVVCARAPVCCRLPARPRRPALSARGARALAGTVRTHAGAACSGARQPARARASAGASCTGARLLPSACARSCLHRLLPSACGRWGGCCRPALLPRPLPSITPFFRNLCNTRPNEDFRMQRHLAHGLFVGSRNIAKHVCPILMIVGRQLTGRSQKTSMLLHLITRTEVIMNT